MEFLPRPADLPMVGGQFLMAQKTTLTTQRDIVIGVGRSVAKASIFLLANPEAGAKAFLKMYPETAPRGSSSEDAVKSVLQAVGRRIKLYAPPYPNAKIGSINQNEFIAEAAMNNLKIANLQSYFTNEPSLIKSRHSMKRTFGPRHWPIRDKREYFDVSRAR